MSPRANCAKDRQATKPNAQENTFKRSLISPAKKEVQIKVGYFYQAGKMVNNKNNTN